MASSDSDCTGINLDRWNFYIDDHELERACPSTGPLVADAVACLMSATDLAWNRRLGTFVTMNQPSQTLDRQLECQSRVTGVVGTIDHVT
jgi:hypothetical protein